jgi:hypothetical protein
MTKGEKTMKRFLSLALALALLCGCVFTLASCGNNPSGKYVGELKTTVAGIEVASVTATYEFSGKNFKLTYSGSLAGFGASLDPQEGTYEIVKAEDGSLEIAFTLTGEAEALPAVPYEKGDDFVKIGGVKYTKAEK